MFFVFDGVDGAGKSTQLTKFATWLGARGFDVETCKDPGTTDLGESMRALLLGDHRTPIDMRSEMLMFMTARAQLVAEIIRPALAAGKAVVCDRYVFSTVVYQGHAGPIDPEQVWTCNQIATDGLMADLTFILDLPVEIASERMGESLDRMESRGSEYFGKVRSGFLAEAKRWPKSARVIDATRSVDEIHANICEQATHYLAHRELPTDQTPRKTT